MAKRGRPPILQAEHFETIVAFLKANPMATWGEIQTELQRSTGLKVHYQTLQTALSEAGVQRRKKGAGVRVEVAEPTTVRYGYNETHRRQEPEQTYPSCLTDSE